MLRKSTKQMSFPSFSLLNSHIPIIQTWENMKSKAKTNIHLWVWINYVKFYSMKESVHIYICIYIYIFFFLRQQPKSKCQQFSAVTITLYPHGCEPKPGGTAGRGWLEPFPASESLWLCFLHIATLRWWRGGCLGLQAAGQSARLRPGLHFPEQGWGWGVRGC